MLQLATSAAKLKPKAEEQSVDASSQALGYASIGIGLAELLAPGPVQNMLGLDDEPAHRGILRVLGVRELMHGVALLASERRSSHQTTSIWSRVAGDVLDSALLGVAATKSKNLASFTAVAAAVAAIGVADLACALRASRRSEADR